jgi:DHA3 family macrolide efflux protein-like MFS transporter
MRIVSALKIGPIRTLWSALVLSSIGDELFTFAVVWLATAELGRLAGYILSLQAVTILFSTLVAGGAVEALSKKGAMVWADLARMVATLLPFAWWLVDPHVPIGVIVAAVVLTSFFRPIFDPPLQATLPILAPETGTLKAVNSLFDATRRLSRTLGPPLAAFLSRWVSVYLLFVGNALSFLASALAVLAIAKAKPEIGAPPTGSLPGTSALKRNIATIEAGLKALKRQPAIAFHLLAYTISGGSWYAAMIVAVAYRIRLEHPQDPGAFGYVLGIYGVFNVLANIVAGESRFDRPLTEMSIGRIVSGTGLVCMGFAHSIGMTMLFAAISATGAPVTQIPLATLLQTSFSGDDVARVFRVRLFFEWLFIFLALLLAPTMLRLAGPSTTMVMAGSLYLFFAGLGLLIARERAPAATPEISPAERRGTMESQESPAGKDNAVRL